MCSEEFTLKIIVTLVKVIKKTKRRNIVLRFAYIPFNIDKTVEEKFELLERSYQIRLSAKEDLFLFF